jgi:hypothetical protein
VKRLLIIGLLGLSACSNATGEAPPLQRTKGVPETELQTEYEFEPYPGSRWFGPDGDEIAKDSNIINAITGPEHCNWQSAVMMHVGWPLGHDAADISEARLYLRDPEQVFFRDTPMSTFDADADLPERAKYTGYRTDFMELWLAKKDDAAAYLVFVDHVERWPRSEDAIACA